MDAFDCFIEQDLNFDSFGNLGSNYTLVQTPLDILGPLVAILNFAGGAALQAVSECPWAARLVLLLLKCCCI